MMNKTNYVIVVVIERCTTPRRLSLTIAIKSVYIAPKDANNHRIYVKQIKVTNLNRYKRNRPKPLKK